MKFKALVCCSLVAMLGAASFAVEPGSEAPAFTLKDQEGNEHSLADYKGKVVVLEWFSTECPFVVDVYDRGVTNKIVENHVAGNENIVYLGVDSSHFANAEDLKAWIEKYNVQHPILLDPTGEVGRKYGAKTTPHMFVIDAEGVVKYNGALDNNAFNRNADNLAPYTINAITSVLEGNPIENAKTEPWGCTVKYGKHVGAAKEAAQDAVALTTGSIVSEDEVKAKSCGEKCDDKVCTEVPAEVKSGCCPEE